ncbi:MAG: type I methionyl aminopeptidase [Spirochaetales bacterium]|uniref:Methionine aminopeptidase n=1 Tax=Candidatus Thalassospirochaeta sargassi TaxID=3119039 RepID=A0AAJ1IEF1_9SPIO|nr:type I methionyl aminopeptidase [Spirochaetales bacterium]
MGYSYVPLKLKNEVMRIKTACRLTRGILDELVAMTAPGITTREIDLKCRKLIIKRGAEAGLLGFKGFPAVICASVNHVAAHGVPNKYTLQSGDIITLDLTAGVDGWYGDTAVTFGLGEISREKADLIEAARQATAAGINAAVAGARMGDIGEAVSRSAREHGYNVLRNFIGHGIGREIHEEPAVLYCGESGEGRPIVPGMVFTVEPILTPGKDEVETLIDGWSVVTCDRMPCAQFEHTIAVFGDHTEILTEL